MDAFGVVLTIVVLLAVALAVLLFEARRARRIERDLTSMARDRARDHRDRP